MQKMHGGTADNNTLGAASGDRHPTGQSTQNMHNEYTEWQQEWRRQDELDRQRNLSILKRAQENPDQQLAWLGYLGFAKEDEARLARKLHWLKWEEQHGQVEETTL